MRKPFDYKSALFDGTPMQKYVCNSDIEPRRCVENYQSAVKAFVNESRAALSIGSDSFDITIHRYESPRTFIIKLLIAVGLLPRDYTFAVAAKLIETLCINPKLQLNEAIAGFAATHGAVPENISRAIEKTFNPYDMTLMRRIKEFTQSNPMTAKDALCDIAVYVRAKYVIGRMNYERHFEKPLS